MLIAPPPTTRGNSAGLAAKLCRELWAGPALPPAHPELPDTNPAAPRPGCKVVLLAPGYRAYKTHFGNKVPLPGARLRLKASGRKRTHPLASHHRQTRVPEREMPAPPVPVRTGDPQRTLFSGSRSQRPLGSTPLGCFPSRCSLGGSGSPWRLHGCYANRVSHEPPRDNAYQSLQRVKLL